MENCLSSNDGVKLIAVADAFADNAKNCLGRPAEDEAMPTRSTFPKSASSSVSTPTEMQSPPVPTSCSWSRRPVPSDPLCSRDTGRKHVFMEKPCCVDAPGFRSLMETKKLADEKGLKVAVGLQRRRSKEFVAR